MNRKSVINAAKAIILKKAKPERIWLYGSEASGESSETSDIDIAYLGTQGDTLVRSRMLTEIKDEIESIDTLVKIDVSNIALCESRFIERVKTTGKVLYSQSKPLRAEDAIYNYSRALTKLIEGHGALPTLIDSGLQDIYLDLIVKRFEFTFEMSWKAIKRTLSMMGIEDVRSPRACFKEAFAQALLIDQVIWLDMIEMRNLSSHTYDESEMLQLKDKLPSYIEAFQYLLNQLELQLNDF